MAGHVPHLEIEPAEVELLTARQRLIDSGKRLDLHAELRCLQRGSVVQSPVIRMQMNGRRNSPNQARDAFDVVEMGVGQKDGGQAQLALLQQVRHGVACATWIYRDRFAASLAPGDVAVLLEARRGERLDLQ